jgi:hypothetical protein
MHVDEIAKMQETGDLVALGSRLDEIDIRLAQEWSFIPSGARRHAQSAAGIFPLNVHGSRGPLRKSAE